MILVVHLMGNRHFTLGIAICVVFASRLEAHALGIECKLHADKVVVTAYFSDDTSARDAAVRVEDAQKRPVAEGRTDAHGAWSFARPRTGRYTVIVDAGGGHRAEVKVVVPPAEGLSPAEPTSPVTISKGPARGEFTATPWLKIGIGIGTISVIGFAWWLSRRAARPG